MTLLFVDCCISQRGCNSRTRRLAEAYLDAFRAHHPDWAVETVDLTRTDLRPMTADTLNVRDALALDGKFDDPMFALARQFRDADRVVVAAPFWDLSFPAVLRTYIEHICANGVGYHYDEHGPHGDCRADRLTYLTTGGDFQRPGSLGVDYWRQLTEMLGIAVFDFVFAGGLDADPEKAEETLAKCCADAAELAAE